VKYLLLVAVSIALAGCGEKVVETQSVPVTVQVIGSDGSIISSIDCQTQTGFNVTAEEIKELCEDTVEVKH
jgi:hypothetical protein